MVSLVNDVQSSDRDKRAQKAVHLLEAARR